MNRDPSPPESRGGIVQAWNRFWFTPMDPIVLGAMRWSCGLITLYTLAMYSFALQDFMGERAWLDLPIRLKQVQGRPNNTFIPSSLNPLPLPTPLPPTTPEETRYVEEYKRVIGVLPPGPHPRDQAEATYCLEFRKKYGIDLRYFGLYPPRNLQQRQFLEEWMSESKVIPPSQYPLAEGTEDIDKELANEWIEDLAFFGSDPKAAPTRGMKVFSAWFHVVDPTTMAVLHGIFLIAAAMFTIGLATRLTSVVTWFAALSYIHRSPISLFGVDTIMMVMLMYLMIGPSGAALSVDRWLQRLRAGAPLPPPEATVSANFMIRMFQVHLCIIYFIAGIAKLLGRSWWQGTAVWNTLANFEHSPMQHDWYVALLQTICANQYVFETLMTAATFFTVGFEISYPFLIWKPRTRWWMLGAAILLHGFIGLCMGLRTFSLMMLAMNLAFVKPDEVRWALRLVLREKMSESQAQG